MPAPFASLTTQKGNSFLLHMMEEGAPEEELPKDVEAKGGGEDEEVQVVDAEEGEGESRRGQEKKMREVTSLETRMRESDARRCVYSLMLKPCQLENNQRTYLDLRGILGDAQTNSLGDQTLETALKEYFDRLQTSKSHCNTVLAPRKIE